MKINLKTLDIETIKDPIIQAVLICLFTDARVEDDELPSDEVRNRGWWGDAILVTIAGKKVLISWGSNLWLLKRAKLNEDTVRLAKVYIEQALKPLIDSGTITLPKITVIRAVDTLNFVIELEQQVLEIEGF